MFKVYAERTVRPGYAVLSLPESANRSVRPELVEGQSRIFANEAITPNEGYGYMLRQAQHERFPRWLSLVKLAVANTAANTAMAAL